MFKFNSIILTLILSTGLLSQGIDMRDEAIEARIKPLASACMQGEDCGIASSGPGY